MSATVIEKLVAELGFNVDAKGLDSFDKKLTAAKTGMMRFAAVASIGVAAIAGVSKAFFATSSKAEQFQRLSERANVATQNYQRLAAAFSAAGISSNALDSGLASLSDKLRDISIGDAGALRGFARLGVNVRLANGQLKTSDQLLIDVAENLKNLNRAQRGIALKDLGIGDELAFELERGADNIKRLLEKTKEIPFIFSEQQKKELTEANEQFRILKDNVIGLKDQLTAGLGPTFANFGKTANDAVTNFRERLADDEPFVLTTIASTISKTLLELNKSLVLASVSTVKNLANLTLPNLESKPELPFLQKQGPTSNVSQSEQEMKTVSSGPTNNINNTFNIEINGAQSSQDTADAVLTAIDARIAADNLGAGVV